MCMCTCICLVLSYLLLLLVRYAVVAYLALTVEARPCPPTWRSFTKQTLFTGIKKKKKLSGKKQQQQTTKKLSFFTCIIQPILEGFLLANEYSHCGSCPCYRILPVPLRSTYLNCNYGFKTSPTCCGLPSVAGATQHRKADPCFFFFFDSFSFNTDTRVSFTVEAEGRRLPGPSDFSAPHFLFFFFVSFPNDVNTKLRPRTHICEPVYIHRHTDTHTYSHEVRLLN